MIWLLQHHLYLPVLQTAALITITYVIWWVMNGGGWRIK